MSPSTGFRILPSVIHGCSEADIIQISELCFMKHWLIGHKKNIHRSLPPPENFFTTKWRAVSLEQVKGELNAVKSLLNNFNLNEWHSLTARANHSGNVINHVRKEIAPELPTQAWCKFHAILGEYPSIVPLSGTFNTFHLCEAPGAFIASLNHFIQQKRPDLEWDWLASTLNPYFEGNAYSSMINDDRLILATLEQWCFGEDNTGDIFSDVNLNNIIYSAKRLGNIKLVTADGSIDCQDDPGEQEMIVSKLHYAETIAALHILEKGGSFVLKMFTCFEAATVCLLYLLFCLFKKVHMIKPAPSKEGNSEVYLVCLDYIGKEAIPDVLKVLKNVHGKDTSENMFSNDSIPYEFLNEVIMCARYFKDIQVSVILRNIELFQQDSSSSKAHDEWMAINKIRQRVADKFIEVYDIKPIDPLDFLISQENKRTIYSLDRKFDFGSFMDKKNRSKESLECVQMVMSLLNTVKFKWVSRRTFNIPPNEADDLESVISLKTGQSFLRVHSSCFSSSNLLNVFNMLIDHEMYTDYFNKCYPESDENHVNVSSLPWLYNFYHAKMNAFNAIKTQLEKTDLGGNMTVIGLPLISGFNVGLVYCLCYLFSRVEIEKNYHLCFRGLRSKSLVLFDRTNECIKRISASKYVLLSLVPMSTLIQSRLFKFAVEANHVTLEAIVRNYCESLREKNGWERSQMISDKAD